MVTALRLPTVAVAFVCILVAPSNSTVFASEPASLIATAKVAVPPSTSAEPRQPLHLSIDPAHLPLLLPAASTALEAQGYRGRRYGRRHDAALTAIVIGAAATIAGAAVLTYANRPECSVDQFAGGCGYGTKVVGTAVLAGGVVGLFAGAVTW